MGGGLVRFQVEIKEGPDILDLLGVLVSNSPALLVELLCLLRD